MHNNFKNTDSKKFIERHERRMGRVDRAIKKLRELATTTRLRNWR